jgi:hypothetical protein
MKNTVNHNNEREISDEALVLFFDAKEAGKSFPDALTVAGIANTAVDLTDLHALWDMHGNLMREAHNISPSRNLLQKTLNSLGAPASVTTPTKHGYESESEQNMFIRVIHNFNTMSQMNWKIGAPIAVLVLAVVAVASVGGSKPSEKLAVNDVVKPESALMDVGAPVENTPEVASVEAGDMTQTTMSRSAKSVDSAPPASGEVDDLIASLVLEAGADVTLLDDATGDLALITSDSQSINDFNTAYDETTF